MMLTKILLKVKNNVDIYNIVWTHSSRWLNETKNKDHMVWMLTTILNIM